MSVRTEQHFKAPVNLTGQYTSRIQPDVMAGTRPEDLGKARLQVKVTVTTELARFEFTAGSLQTAQKFGHIQAVVEKIDQDIAQVGAENG